MGTLFSELKSAAGRTSVSRVVRWAAWSKTWPQWRSQDFSGWEDQNEEENEENLRKNERKYRKVRKG